MAATAIERYVDDKALFDNEARTEYLLSGVVSAGTVGLGKFVPQAKHWLIKNPSSYLTTGTGGQFIRNQFAEQIIGSIVDKIVQGVYSSNSGGRPAFKGKGDKSTIGGLADASTPENAKGKTAGQIIREWRAKQKSDTK